MPGLLHTTANNTHCPQDRFSSAQIHGSHITGAPQAEFEPFCEATTLASGL